MLIGFICWVVLGTIAGFIASKVISLRGDDPRMGIAAAVVGAVIGGWLYTYFSTGEAAFHGMSLLFAAIAAVVALTAWHGWRWKSAA
jgi:uncharacterized membrane protein YeaQ/YmgE (transglycosylase-associated protein family)